jgi:hypothetical protein
MALLFSATYVRFAASSHDSSERGQVRIRLANYGRDSRYPSVQLVYVNEDRLAVSFAATNPNFGLSTRGSRTEGSHFFKTLFIDPKSGEVTAERQWGNYQPSNELAAVADGRLVVGTDEKIALYRPDLQAISERALAKAKYIPHFILLVSPLGRRLYVLQPADGGGRNVSVLDAATLALIGSFSLPARATSITANQEWLVYTVPGPRSDAIKISPQGDEKPISPDIPDGCARYATYLSESLLLVGGCQTAFLIDDGGKVLKSLRPKGQPSWTMMLAITAKSFCRLTANVGKGLPALDISPSIGDIHLTCFDDFTLEPIIDLPLKWLPKHRMPVATSVAPDLSTAAFCDQDEVTIVPLRARDSNTRKF